MYHDICKEAPKCIRGARNVMIFTIMLALGLSISYYSDLTPLGVDNEFLSTLYAQTSRQRDRSLYLVYSNIFLSEKALLFAGFSIRSND